MMQHWGVWSFVGLVVVRVWLPDKWRRLECSRVSDAYQQLGLYQLEGCCLLVESWWSDLLRALCTRFPWQHGWIGWLGRLRWCIKEVTAAVVYCDCWTHNWAPIGRTSGCPGGTRAHRPIGLLYQAYQLITVKPHLSTSYRLPSCIKWIQKHNLWIWRNCSSWKIDYFL